MTAEKNEQQLFSFTLEEHNGEHEYTSEHLCYASSEEEALGIADEYAKCFYDDDVRGKWDEFYQWWEFEGGAIAIEVHFRGATTLAAWTQRQVRRALANEAPPKEMGEPDIMTLMQWYDAGQAQATDGCRVELDGHCPHGKPSWFIVLGLI